MGRLHAVVGKLDRNADGMLAAIEIVKVCGPTEATAIAGCGAVPGESAGLLSRGVIWCVVFSQSVSKDDFWTIHR